MNTSTNPREMSTATQMKTECQICSANASCTLGGVKRDVWVCGACNEFVSERLAVREEEETCDECKKRLVAGRTFPTPEGVYCKACVENHQHREEEGSQTCDGCGATRHGSEGHWECVGEEERVLCPECEEDEFLCDIAGCEMSGVHALNDDEYHYCDEHYHGHIVGACKTCKTEIHDTWNWTATSRGLSCYSCAK